MPRLTIIIPALRMDREFEDTLASVLRNQPSRSRVVVAHQADYADPYDLAGEVAFLKDARAGTVAELIHSAVQSADAPLIHVVGCGLEADEAQWRCDLAVAAFGKQRDLGLLLPGVSDSSTNALHPWTAFFRRRAWLRTVEATGSLSDVDFAALVEAVEDTGYRVEAFAACRLRLATAQPATIMMPPPTSWWRRTWDWMGSVARSLLGRENANVPSGDDDEKPAVEPPMRRAA